MWVGVVRSSYGDCIITAGTRSLSKEQEKRYGMVSGHCYCVVRVATGDSAEA